MALFGGVLTKRIRMGVLSADRLCKPVPEIFDRLKQYRPAACHMLNDDRSLAIIYTNRSVLIRGDDPEYTEDDRRVVELESLIPLQSGYENFFLEVPNFAYSIWCPQPRGAIMANKAIWLCPNIILDGRVEHPASITDWANLAVDIEFDVSPAKLMIVQRIVSNWLDLAIHKGIAGETMLSGLSVDHCDWGLSCIMGAKHALFYSILDLYLRIQDETRFRPITIHVREASKPLRLVRKARK